MSKYESPSMPLVEAKHQGGKQKPTAIILRPSFTHSRDGAALAVAKVWHRGESFWDAAHYVVDDTKRFRCVEDNVIAGTTKEDKGAIRIAICAEPYTNTVFWNAIEHELALEKTAKLIAELMLVHKIKHRYLDDAEKARWGKFRTRSRGGIYVTETNGWSTERFAAKVDYHLTVSQYI